MRRRIPFGRQFVRSASDDPAIANDDRSNGTIASIAGFSAKFEDFAHDDMVAFGAGISHCRKLLSILLPVSPPWPEKMSSESTARSCVFLRLWLHHREERTERQ
jgi:hypothetical protein